MSPWTSPAHALDYLARADRIPHRTEGEAALLTQVTQALPHCTSILDLGTGDGRLLALVKLDRPEVPALAVDFSPTMLAAVRKRFQDDPTVTVVDHNLEQPLPAWDAPWDSFDLVVSSFAIHHLPHPRKRALYGEMFARLRPGGLFCNLEHVASPTERLHRQFLTAIGYSPETEDPANQLLDVQTQLEWLRDWGFEDVDCYWKWLEMALLIGVKPT